MPDWNLLISERIGTLALSPQVRDEIVAELATHLEELYQASRARLSFASITEDAEAVAIERPFRSQVRSPHVR